jgi:L-ascorbate metabolism protein UlaG (beta-lactamase superfamily)
MELVYYGQSCFQVSLSRGVILIDPFISTNPLSKNRDISNINPDYILLTHGHGDHTYDAEAIARNSNATIISNYEITTWYERKGIGSTHGMNIGGSYHFPFGRLKMVNAIHSSSMPDGSYGGNAAGYVIETSEKTFYHAGDTSFFSDMKLIGDEFDLDFAFLPVGDNFTMGIDDALNAASLLNTTTIIAMHFDTFPVIEIDHAACREKASAKKIDLIIPKIGESLTV